MRLLIVDDHLSVAETLASALAGAHDVAGVLLRARDVLPWLLANRCDCVVLDLVLPDANGLDTIRQIKDCHPSLPVVATSGYDHPSSRVEALAAGASAFVPKSGAFHCFAAPWTVHDQISTDNPPELDSGRSDGVKCFKGSVRGIQRNKSQLGSESAGKQFLSTLRS